MRLRHNRLRSRCVHRAKGRLWSSAEGGRAEPGRIVEIAPANKLCTQPLHPYTEALLAAVPIPDPRVKRKHIRLHGDVPSAMHPPPGCHFHTRCPIPQQPLCNTEKPELEQSSDGHWMACHVRG